MRIGNVLAICGMAAGLCLGQATSLESGTKVNAELKSKLDSQHAKVGDKVTAVSTSAVKEHGETVLPKGAILTGHVTEVTRAESKKSPSRIGVLFDQARTKQGQVIPLRAGIASVFAAQASSMADLGGPPEMGMPNPQPMPQPGMNGGGAMGGGLLGGAVNTAARATSEVDGSGNSGNDRRMTLGDQPLPAVMTTADGEITSMARASNGSPLSVMVPKAQASASQQTAVGSVLSTPRGDVKLDSGTRLQLVVIGGGQ